MSKTFLWKNYTRYSTAALEREELLDCAAIFDPYNHASGAIYCYVMFSVREIAAILSLVSCCFVVFIIWVFKRYIFDTQRLILYLSLSALFSSLMYAVTEIFRFFSSSNDGCAAFIFFLTFSIWSVIIWNLSITFKLFLNIVLWKTSPKWFEKMFIATALVIPILFASLTILPQFIQDITFQCQWNSWNATRHFNIRAAQAFYGSIWVAPSTIAFITVIIAYLIIFLIMVKIRVKRQDLEISKVLVQDIKSLIMYPVVILAAYCIPLLLALINLSETNIELRYLYFLIVVAAFTRPLVGFLISIVYISKKDNRKQLSWKHIKLGFLSHLKRTKIKEYPITQMDHNFKQTTLHLEHSFRLPAQLSSERILEQLPMEEINSQDICYSNPETDNSRIL